ncbi:hypothetical protein PMIN04_011254 [Paraphaeosphaeria minitans]
MKPPPPSALEEYRTHHITSHRSKLPHHPLLPHSLRKPNLPPAYPPHTTSTRHALVISIPILHLQHIHIPPPRLQHLPLVRPLPKMIRHEIRRRRRRRYPPVGREYERRRRQRVVREYGTESVGGD